MSSLVSHLDAECRQAVDLARPALPEGQRLDVGGMLDALFHGTTLADDPPLAAWPDFFPSRRCCTRRRRPPPSMRRSSASCSNCAAATRSRLSGCWPALARSDAGRLLLVARRASGGIAPPHGACRKPHGRPGRPLPRTPGRPLTEARIRMMRDLRDYGVILTEPPGPPLPPASRWCPIRCSAPSCSTCTRRAAATSFSLRPLAPEKRR